MKKLRLYDVPRNTKIFVEHLGLVLIDSGKKVKELEFKHCDGAYSLCYHKGDVVKLSANVEVYIK